MKQLFRTRPVLRQRHDRKRRHPQDIAVIFSKFDGAPCQAQAFGGLI
jgi:hypothetical protein